MERQSGAVPKTNAKQELPAHEVATSEKNIVDLASRGSIHGPMTKLSPELLLQIFDILKDDEYYPFNHHLGRPFLTKHIIVHVCRYWRSLAFSAPLLWNKPPLWVPDWALMYLRNSQSVPLDIEIFFTGDPVWKAALRQMPRIKVLTVQCYLDLMTEIQNFVRNDQALDAPLLEKLDINSRQKDKSKPSSLKLLSDTFRRADALRSLKLTNVTIPWDSPLLRGKLTTLEIFDAPLLVRPTWRQLVDVLHGLPSLETLRLSRVCPLKDEILVTDAVHLPNLHTLTIDCDTASQIQSFLSQVTFPPLREVGCGCYALSEGSTDYMEVFASLSKLIPADMNVGEAVDRIKIWEEENKFDPPGHDIGLESSTLTSFPSVRLHLPYLGRTYGTAGITSLINSLALFNLRFLGLYTRSSLLTKCFQSQQKVVAIEIGHTEEIPPSTEALEIPRNNPPNEPIPFPNLKVIGLTDIHGLPWHDRYTIKDNNDVVNKDDKSNADDDHDKETRREKDKDIDELDGSEGSDDSWEDDDEFDRYNYDPWELSPKRTWTDFRNCLIQRSKYGAPVEELHVQRCTGLTKKWFDIFHEVVPVMTWDKGWEL